MKKMVRKQVYIEPEQDEKLKRLAERLGVTESELIRRGIELIERQGVSEGERRAAAERLIAMLEERARRHAGVPQIRRTWTRDELYDERPKYLSNR